MGKDKMQVRQNLKTGEYHPYKFFGKVYSCEELSAMILSQLKRDVEKAFGLTKGDTIKAIITCPAYFGDKEKSATRVAGEIAGLKVLDIIAEPIAAGLSYCAISNKKYDRVLVFDLCGGTFDVTILEIKDSDDGKNINMIAADGDHKLGGKDFDDSIISYMIDQFKKKYGVDIDYEDINNRERVRGELRLDVERAKVALFNDSKNKGVDLTIRYGGKSLTEKITSDKYTKITKIWIDKCKTYCENALNAAKMNWHDIDTILVVGNQSRCTPIRAALKNWCGKNVTFGVINPKTCVSEGAAIKANGLCGNNIVKRLKENVDFDAFEQNSENLKICEEAQKTFERTNTKIGDTKSILPYTIRLLGKNRDDNRVAIPMLKKNTQYPTSVTRSFPPYNDTSNTLELKVMQGEDEDADLCEMIGSATIDFSGVIKQGELIDVTFSIDASGILKLLVKNKEHGIDFETKIKRQGAISLDEINDAKKDIEECNFYLG